MIKELKKPDFHFYCKNCKKEVSFELKDKVFECDTPIGNVKQVGCEAFCSECCGELQSRDLERYNSILMSVATVGFWRAKNPKGTRKQCHRDLGLHKQHIDYFWDISLEELPEEERNKALCKTKEGGQD